jgi:hypothetical protein
LACTATPRERLAISGGMGIIWAEKECESRRLKAVKKGIAKSKGLIIMIRFVYQNGQYMRKLRS